MVQHVADWIAPFPRSQHSPPPPPLKFFHTPPSPPPLFLSLTCTRVRDNYYHEYPTDEYTSITLLLLVKTEAMLKRKRKEESNIRVYFSLRNIIIDFRVEF